MGEELWKYIRSENTDTKLLLAIASAVTYYCDDFDELLSIENLPNINMLLEDKSISSKFLECLESILISKLVYDDDRMISTFIGPLEKIFNHQNTTQEMLRYACNYGWSAYVIDKLDKNDPLNRKILKEIKNEDLNLDIRKQASQILKEDSNIKPKAVAFLINLNSLMQEYIRYSHSDFQTLSDYNITGSLLQKLSLLLKEMAKFREQTDAEKLIFIPVFSKIYEYYGDRASFLDVYKAEYTNIWIPGDSPDVIRKKVKQSIRRGRSDPDDPIDYGHFLTYYTKLSRDYALFDEHLDFCKWLYFCIAKIVNDGYISKEGNIIMTDNIIFDTGFYYDGYIKAEKLEKCGNFKITKKYIRDKSMKDQVINYIDELATDYKLLQVVDSNINNSAGDLSFYDNLAAEFPSNCSLYRKEKIFYENERIYFGEDIPVSLMCPDGYFETPATDFNNLNGKIYFNAKDILNYIEITNDGIFSDVSNDDNYQVIINANGTFSVRVIEKGYDGIIQCFKHLNVALKERQELIKQEKNKVLFKNENNL